MSSPSPYQSSTLPPARLLVTSVDPSTGTSHFTSDGTVTPFFPFGPAVSSFSVFHNVDHVPTSNLTPPPADLGKSIPRCPPRGALFCVTDIPPKYTVPMHRTTSVDYLVVLAGSIVLRLDDGEEREIGVGEVLVQRGTCHQWVNRSETEACRFLAVMVGAEEIALLDGTVLEQTKLGPPK